MWKAANDDWNSEDERELSRLEAKLDEERFASFDPYDDGYDSNNFQTWDHPDHWSLSFKFSIVMF